MGLMRKIILYAAVRRLGSAPLFMHAGAKESSTFPMTSLGELYEQVNKAFIADWKTKTGEYLMPSTSPMPARRSRRVLFWKG